MEIYGLGAMPTLAVGMFSREFTCSHKCEHGTRLLFQQAANPGAVPIFVLMEQSQQETASKGTVPFSLTRKLGQSPNPSRIYSAI